MCFHEDIFPIICLNFWRSNQEEGWALLTLTQTEPVHPDLAYSWIALAEKRHRPHWGAIQTALEVCFQRLPSDLPHVGFPSLGTVSLPPMVSLPMNLSDFGGLTKPGEQ